MYMKLKLGVRNPRVQPSLQPNFWIRAKTFCPIKIAKNGVIVSSDTSTPYQHILDILDILNTSIEQTLVKIVENKLRGIMKY